MTDDKEKMIVRRMGRRVRTGRVFKNMTGTELAARAGLTRRRLKRTETGTGRRATADELTALARALELPLWFFFEVPLTPEPSVCRPADGGDRLIIRRARRSRCNHRPRSPAAGVRPGCCGCGRSRRRTRCTGNAGPRVTANVERPIPGGLQYGACFFAGPVGTGQMGHAATADGRDVMARSVGPVEVPQEPVRGTAGHWGTPFCGTAFSKIAHTSCSPGMKRLWYTFLPLLAPWLKRMISVPCWRSPAAKAIRLVWYVRGRTRPPGRNNPPSVPPACHRA